jgi:hypothetical protein
LLIADLALVVAANELKIFETLKTFGAGGYSIPIVPAAHILLFFFACGLISVFVSARFREGSRGDGMLMLVSVSVGALPAALGRCDTGHVALSGMGILIVATVLASNFPRVWSWYRAVFVVVFILYPGFLSLVEVPASLASRIVTQQRTIKSDACKVVLGVKDKMLAPFGYAPRAFCQARSEMISTGYFYGVINVFSPMTVDRKIAEMTDQPEQELLLPNDFGQCEVNAAAEKRYVRLVLAYPYGGKAIHPVGIVEPLCRYIYDHYRRAAGGFGGYDSEYSVWTRVNYPVH